MSQGLVTIERLLDLLSGEPRHGVLAAERLAKLVLDLDGTENDPSSSSNTSLSPQVQLLWRIAGYLSWKKWECRVAAALSLEKVGVAMAPAGLLHSLLGTTESHADTEVRVGAGLLSLGGLDISVVLRDGDVLQSSGGEEYAVPARRGPLAREELERQKLAIIKKLGLMQGKDIGSKRAYEVGGTEGLGIRDKDLEDGQAVSGQEPQQQQQPQHRSRKRKLSQLAAGRQQADEASREEKGDGSGGDPLPPWLAEHLSVRLFDAKWETRHGAALGLMALFKAWRIRQQQQPQQQGGKKGEATGPWLMRWAEDLACRCLCLLALDRFADYSMGTTVAPVREVSAQLLALLVAAVATDDDGKGQGRRQERRQDLLTGADVLSVVEVLAVQEAWEVRHGAYVGLKYLVAVPSKFVEVEAERLLALGLRGLEDPMDDVKDAAASSVLSVLTCRPVPLASSSAAPPPWACSIRFLRPVLRLLPEADDTSPHLRSFLTLGLRCLEEHIVDDGGGSARKGKAAAPDSSNVAVTAALIGRLWSVSHGGDETVKVLALKLLRSLVLRASSAASRQGSSVVVSPLSTEARGLMLPSLWRVFEALSTITSQPHVVSALLDLWTTLSTTGVALPQVDHTLPPAGLEAQLLVHYSATDLHQPAGQAWDPEQCKALRSSSPPGSLLGPGEGDDCFLCRRRGQGFPFTARRQAAKAVALLASHRLASDGQGDCSILRDAVEKLRGSPWACVKEAMALLLGEFMAIERPAIASSSLAWSKEGEAREGLMALLVEAATGDDKEGAAPASDEILLYEELKPFLPSQQELGSSGGPALRRVRLPATSSASPPPSVTPAAIRTSCVTIHRRVLTAAAAALALSRAPPPTRLGPVIKSLMEAIKAEQDPMRVTLAAEALSGLVYNVVQGGEGSSSKGRKACDKVVGNLCALSCAFNPEDQLVTSTRNAAREALRALGQRCGAKFFELLPCLWERMGTPLERSETAGEVPSLEAVEDAIRLLLVLLPHLEGENLALALGIRLHVYRRAVGEREGKLVNRLAARTLGQMLRKQGASLAAEVGPRIKKTLTAILIGGADEDVEAEGDDGLRAAAAHCLLELAQAVRGSPWGDDGSGSRACVPHLLPAALAIVADHDPEVRVPGSEAFRLLVELAPLLDRQSWHQAMQTPQSSHATTAVPSCSSSYDNVIRLVVGERLEPMPLPAAVQAVMRGGLSLRPYQVEGVQWLNLLAQAGLNGALCDEMGLGKTVQTLTALALYRYQQRQEQGTEHHESMNPAIIVCPSSLCGHWYHETRRFFVPEAIDPVVFKAGLSKADKVRLLGPKGLPGGGRGLVIISYGLMRQEIGLLEGIMWDYAIFDEGHVLRNDKSAVCRAARRIKASHRVVLTGTPIHNQVHELWTMFDLLMPGLLGASIKEFNKEYGRPIGKATLKSASAEITAEAITKLEQLQAHLLPFMLRRDKSTVLRELPPKVLTDVACELSPLQERMYTNYCQTDEVQGVLKELRDLAGGGDGGGASLSLMGGTDALRQMGARALRLLHHLRMLCVHPALVLDRQIPQTAAARERLLELADCSGKLMMLQSLLFSCGVITEVAQEEEEEAQGEAEDGQDEEEGHDEEDDDDDEAAGSSAADMVVDDEEASTSDKEGEDSHGKVVGGAVGKKAEEEQDGADLVDGRLHRCLVFAQHRDTLDAIERSLLRKVTWNPAYGGGEAQVRYLRLDGQVPSGKREELVRRFNTDRRIPLMLLTTKVGGLGLNLTGADVVIFVEHDWNPQVDLQAMDRAHRIGQERSVSVYRLVTTGTVEEQILSLQKHKQRVANAVVASEPLPQEGDAKAGSSIGGGDAPGTHLLDRRLARVVDVVSASVGQASGSSQQVNAFEAPVEGGEGGGAVLRGAAGTGGGVVGALPTEEVWDDDQYNSFEVEAFLANVLGTTTHSSGLTENAPKTAGVAIDK